MAGFSDPYDVTDPYNSRTPPQPGQKSRAQRVGDFFNSPGGQAAVQGAGALFDARENRQANQQMLQQQDRMNQRSLGVNAREGLMADDRARAAGVLDANPLGAMQTFAGRNAFLAAAPQMFSGMGSALTPSDPAVAAAMPKGGFNFQLPPGFAEQMAKTYGQDATAASIAQRQMDLARLDPRMGNAGVLGSLGLGDTSGLESKVSAFQQGEQDYQSQQREALLRAIDNNPTGGASPQDEFNENFEAIKAAKAQTGDWEKAYQMVTGKAWPKGQNIRINADGTGGEMVKGGSFMGTLGKIGKVALPIAASVIGGPLAGMAAGAITGAMDGGGLKGAILGGAGGALGGGAAKPFTIGALGKAMVSPKALTGMASQFANGNTRSALQLANTVAPPRWRPGGGQ